MESSQIRDGARVSCIGRRIPYHWASGKPCHLSFWIQRGQKREGGPSEAKGIIKAVPEKIEHKHSFISRNFSFPSPRKNKNKKEIRSDSNNIWNEELGKYWYSMLFRRTFNVLLLKNIEFSAKQLSSTIRTARMPSQASTRATIYLTGITLPRLQKLDSFTFWMSVQPALQGLWNP